MGRADPGRRSVIELAERIAREAGAQLREAFSGAAVDIQTKSSPTDLVSAADVAAETLIREALLAARPDDGMLGEEGSDSPGTSGLRWIVDPLDGTTNFLHAVPHFAISIALERQGELVAGVIYDPIKDELFAAEKGAGAYVNDRRLRVSRRSDLATCLIATGIPVLDWPGRAKGFARQLERVADQVAGIRRLGTASLDLAYVAAGRFDGFWEYDLKAWDMAAGIVLVREAGGLVGRLEGDEDLLGRGTLIAANPAVYPRLGELLQAAADG
jgi:myo-inositol-1(or 4)-monophosphatase